MKKIFALMIVFVMCLMCVACGETAGTSNAEVSNQSTVSEWKQFINDYDAWADKYVEFVKKYKENPTDATILAEYTEMAAEVASWAERAEKLEKDLTAEEAAEYSAQLLKIAEKLQEAANLLQ